MELSRRGQFPLSFSQGSGVQVLSSAPKVDDPLFRSASPPFPRGARGSCTVQAFIGSRCRARLKVYLMGVVRGLSLVSRTNTASSFAGSVLLALRLIEWVAPGASDQLSPAR